MPAIMSKEFIKGLVDNCPGDLTAESIAEHLYKELKAIATIKEHAKCLQTALYNAKKEYEIVVNKLNAEISSLQDRCKHWSRVYHPDPSGNSDSYYECVECGKCL